MPRVSKGLKETLNDKIQDAEDTGIVVTDIIPSAPAINNVITLPVDSRNELSVERNAISVVPQFAITLNEARERIALLQSFVKEMMIPNVDFGLIPGCKKPSLYKSGAEKLTDIFGLAKHFEVTNRLEDWDKKIFHYEVKAVLINKRTGIVEAEGLGSCCNKEKKYQYQDAYNIINTLLKMAKKRAFVDAVLSATRSSGIFTQDIEDMSGDNGDSPKGNRQSMDTPSVVDNADNPVSKETTKRIMSQIKAAYISLDYAKMLMQKRYNVQESRDLTESQAQDFIDHLKGYKAE